MPKMSNKKALEILLKTDRVGVNLILGNDEETIKYNQDSAEALLTAVKALAVVEEIKKAFHNGWFEDDIYNILCDAYGTDSDRESWIKEYKNE